MDMKKLILIVLLVLGNLSIKAQLFQITNVTIPTNATSCTNTDITTLGQLNCNNFPFDSTSFHISGSTIDIGVYYHELLICTGALAFPTHTVSLGNVQSGSYTVNVTAYLNMGTTSNSTNTISGNLNVMSCCDAIPSISVANSTCKNDSILFTSTSTGAQSYAWYIDNLFISSDSLFLYQFTDTGDYDVKLVVTGTACTDSITETVTVDDLPQIDLGIDTTYCEGDSILISVDSAWANVIWSNGQTGNSTNVSNQGDLIVTVTDINGCQNSDTISISETPAPILQFGDVDTVLCFEELPFIVNAYQAGLTYEWHDGSTDSVYVLNSTGWAACTVTDSVGCSNYDSIFLILVICDGLKDGIQKEFLIYPNPGSTKITIQGKSPQSSRQIARLRNLNGQVLKEIEFSKNEAILNLRELARGQYILEISDDLGHMESHKILLK